MPLFSRRLASGGHEDAQRFSNEILAVFMPTLLVVTVVFEIAMPAFLWLIVSDYADDAGQVRAGGRADPLTPSPI